MMLCPSEWLPAFQTPSQIAMGWSDSHLHRFHIHGNDFGVAHEGGITFTDDPEKVNLADFEFRLRELPV